MPDRLRIYRAEPGPPTAVRGVVFGRDDRGRSRFVLVPRDEAFRLRDQLRDAGRFIDYWTRERADLVERR